MWMQEKKALQPFFARSAVYISFDRGEGVREYIGELSAVIDTIFKGYQGGKIRREKQILLVVQIYLGKKKSPNKIARS